VTKNGREIKGYPLKEVKTLIRTVLVHNFALQCVVVVDSVASHEGSVG